MARRDGKVDRLGTVRLFQSCSPKELKAIASIADQAPVPAGDVLFKQGSTAFDCYVILEGTADVVIDDEVVASVGAGDSVGEMGLIERKPRNATITATSDMEVYVIPANRFRELIASTPALSYALLEALSGRLRRLEEELPAWA